VDLPHAERSSALNPGQYLKHWLLSPKAAGVDRTTRVTDKTTTRTITAGHKAGRLRTGPGTAGPDKRAQMLKMISALEEMDRALHSTLSSRISLLPRGMSGSLAAGDSDSRNVLMAVEIKDGGHSVNGRKWKVSGLLNE